MKGSLRLATISTAFCMMAMISVLPAAASVVLDAALQRRILQRISPKDIKAQMMELAAFSDTPAPSVTRLVFSHQDLAARRHIKGLMRRAGLVVREDAMGNIFGRWEGSQSDAGAVASGSHSDSIVQGGAYDGALGVIGAVAAVKALKDAGFQPAKPLEVIMFTTEEASRFSVPCLGSRGISGHLDPDILDSRLDENGTSFVQAARAAGYPADSAKAYAEQTLHRPEHRLDAFLELHIEQGPVLEEQNTTIGMVTAIAAPAMIRVEFSGAGGHGGGMPMRARNDPALAAAELALAIEKAALGTGATETVATVGLWQQEPNIYNAIPRSVRLDVDIRDTDDVRRDGVMQAAFAAAEAIAQRRRCGLRTETVFAYPAAASDDKRDVAAGLLATPVIVAAVQAGADAAGASSMRMISRGYHDSGLMARIAPVGMVFIPCRKGLSHHQDEYASPEHMAAGVQTLAIALAQLAGGATSGGDSADRTEL